MSDLVAVTYASEDNYHLHRLQTSAAYHGIDLRVLGLGDPWNSLLQKLDGVLGFLQEFAGDQVVMFVDGYDTVFLKPSDVILDRFHAFDSPVVFSAERCFYCPGQESIREDYPPSPTPYRYLNSGSYVGNAGHLVALVAKILQRREGYSDQALFSRHFVEHPGEITLDYQTELFVGTSGRPYEEDFVITDGALVNKETGSRPCVLHTPGKYFGVLEFYSRQLPFYADVKWSHMRPRIFRQIVGSYLGLRLYRALKGSGLVLGEQGCARANFAGLAERFTK